MAMQWHGECTQIKWIKVSVSTILTKCISIFYISPFLISHPNRFRSADLDDSFPPGEAKGAPAPVRQTPIKVIGFSKLVVKMVFVGFVPPIVGRGYDPAAHVPMREMYVLP